MNSIFYYRIPLFFYNYFLIPLAQIILPLVSLFLPKIQEIRIQQKNIWDRIDLKLKNLPENRKHILFHVSSAGEFLQAKPVIESLKKTNPDILIFLTYVSPSAIKWTQNFLDLDFVEFFPIDTKGNVKKLLSLIKPDAIIFVKFDLWPNLIHQASLLKIPLFLVSATLTETSKRFQWKPARYFFKHIYDQLTKILTVSQTDADLFKLTNSNHTGIQVCGDTRTDSVLQRQELFSQQNLDREFLNLRNQFKPIIIAGSSWPEDEAILLPAWKKFLNEAQINANSNPLLILVPHEPTEKHLQELSEALRIQNLSFHLWSKRQQPSTSQFPKADILIFDQVGGLAHLYRIADGAFVGSGKGGVHNTMEPAAWKLPVFFRKTYFNAPEAIALVKQNIFLVTENSTDLLIKFRKILNSPIQEQEIGIKGRLYLEKSQGAAEKSAHEILQFLKNSNRSM